MPLSDVSVQLATSTTAAPNNYTSVGTATTATDGTFTFANDPQAPLTPYQLSVSTTNPPAGYMPVGPGSYALQLALSPQGPISAIRAPSSFVLGDFDSNGDTDFAWVSPAHQTLYVAYGKGGGQFDQFAVTLDSHDLFQNVNFYKIIPIHLYSATETDYAVIDDGGHIYIFTTNSDGDFDYVERITNPPGTPIDLEAADLEGTGQDDLIVASNVTDSKGSAGVVINVYSYRDLAPGAEPTSTNREYVNFPTPLFSYAVYDDNIASQNPDGVQWQLGQLAATTLEKTANIGIIFNAPGLVGVSVISAFYYTGNNGSFPVYFNMQVGPGSVGVGDVNNDGYPDVAITYAGFNQTPATLELASGPFAYDYPPLGQYTIPTSGPIQSMPDTIVADLNGDGLPDLITVSSEVVPAANGSDNNDTTHVFQGNNLPASLVYVYLNQGTTFQPDASGTPDYFTSPDVFALQPEIAGYDVQIAQLTAYHFDGDSQLDLVGADLATGQFVILYNQSQFTGGTITGVTKVTSDSTNNNFIYAQIPGAGDSDADTEVGPPRLTLLAPCSTTRTATGNASLAKRGWRGSPSFLI